MAENEHLPRRLLPGRIPFHPDVITSRSLPQQLYFASAPAALCRDGPAESVYRALVVTGRFRTDKFSKKPRHRAFTSPQPFHELQHLGRFIHRAAMLTTRRTPSNLVRSTARFANQPAAN